MPGVEKKPEQAPAEPKPDLEVVVQFAYATAKTGEVKQLTKGSLVVSDQYTKESIDHLVSIGFLAEPK